VRAARYLTHQPVEVFERRTEQPRDVHLGDPQALPNLGLAQLEAEAHDEDGLGSTVERPEKITHVEAGPGCIAGVDTPEDYRRLVGG